MSKLMSTEEMLIPEEKRELYKEAKELHLKTNVEIGEIVEILDFMSRIHIG